MKKNVMLDLETMGNNSNSAIIAIGAVSFDYRGIGSEFYEQINLASSMAHGMSIDASTVIWWMQQKDEARKKFFDNESAQSLEKALKKFSKWYQGGEVWGCGAAFDNVILSNAYKNSSIEKPWAFWNDRCYRTIRDMNPDVSFERIGTHHNALDDAKSQAFHLIKIIEKNKK